MTTKIKDILKSCGYPERTLVLDCETYFDKDYRLGKMSTYEYVTDDRFEILGWAIKQCDEPAEFMLKLPSLDYKNITVIMHNAPFDALVLAIHNKLYPPFIIDTLDLARHVEPRWKNSLAELCKRHGLIEKGDTDQFKGLHRSDFTGQQWVDLIAYATNDAEREYDLLGLLLPKLSNPKFELRVAEYTRNLFIKPVLHFDMKRAEKLKEKMQAEVKTVVDRLDLTETQIRGNKYFESRIRELLGGEEPPMKIGKKGPILAIAKTDGGYTYLLNHPNDQVRQLMEARVAVKSWPLHIKRIERMERMAKAAGGKLPIPLRYCGAHTARWAGSEGINPQNFTARGHPLANQIRNLIEAPKGCILVIGDFSQIEARTLDWLSEQNDMLRAFAEGRQIYSEFASELIGKKVRKPKKTDNEAVAKWYGNYRQLGKIGILGCFKENTLVLTKRGWIEITNVCSTDKVWDGETWVSTIGPIYRGEKSIIPWRGIGVTPDHPILTQDGWVSAYRVIHDETRYLRSVKSVGNLKSLGINLVLVAEFWRWKLCVWNAVAISIRWICTTFGAEKVPAAINVLKKQVDAGQRNTGNMPPLYPMMDTVPAYSIGFPPFEDAAAIHGINTGKTMGDAVLQSTNRGGKIERLCWRILSHLRGGISRLWTWIVSTTTGGMNQIICDSAHGNKISAIDEQLANYKKTIPVYDL